MGNIIRINEKIKSYKKEILVSGDKSLSIRWILLSSLSEGKSIATNLLKSEDIISSLNCIKKLGVRYKIERNRCVIFGVGLNGYLHKKNLVLNAGNSGTLGRLILGILVHYPLKVKIIGDNSLSKRDFTRITEPLERFGAKFETNKGKLPIYITGTRNPKAIEYLENKGSAQCKSSVMLAALNTPGQTIIKAKKSRDHTEIMFKNLNIPIQIIKKKKIDIIKIYKTNRIKNLNYKIPSDISSAAFFIVLTALIKNSELIIRNVNINPSRIGVIKILKMMGIKLTCKNIRLYKGEKTADIKIKSTKKINAISCPEYLNSAAIDEFLIIFLIAAKAKGVSHFTNLSELNQKESPRLKWGSKILNLMGVKTKITDNSIKIYGNPNLKINKKIIIKNYQKDHRVFMTSIIASLAFGGKWTIHDKDSIKTSFPSFLKIINDIKK